MKISIITAVFNNKEFIENCIQSVAAQTYKDIEYIIIDGGSKDGTLDIIRKYAERGVINKWVSEPDNGMYDALNKGIKMAEGEVIGFLHSDDIFAHERVIERVAQTFMQDNNIDGIYGDLIYINKNCNKIIRYWKAGRFTRDSFNYGWMPPHPTLFIKKEIYEKYGYFRTKFKISADYDLILRFIWKHQIRVVYIPEVLIKMRVGGKSNKNIKNLLLKSFEDYKVIKENRVKGGFVTLLMKNIRKLPQFVHFQD